MKLGKEAISVGVGINKEVAFFSKWLGGKFHCEVRKEAETKDSISETVSNQGLQQEEACDCGVGECTTLAKTQEPNEQSLQMDPRESFTIGRGAQYLFQGILTAVSKAINK